MMSKCLIQNDRLRLDVLRALWICDKHLRTTPAYITVTPACTNINIGCKHDMVPKGFEIFFSHSSFSANIQLADGCHRYSQDMEVERTDTINN